MAQSARALHYSMSLVLTAGARVGGQRLEGFEGETHHPPAFASRHSRRRGVGHAHQGIAPPTYDHPDIQATIAGGGVIPHIHRSLMGKKGTQKGPQ